MCDFFAYNEWNEGEYESLKKMMGVSYQIWALGM